MEEEFLKLLKEQDCNVLLVSEWRTPATDYPKQKIGTAEISKGRYGKGIYFMEGVDNYDLFSVEKPIDITTLKINRKQWMVDDPLHWRGMELLAEKSKGRVLVGGLGLGLIVHSLVKNPKVESIDVVEQNEDVINLIKDKIPDKKVRIIKGDVFSLPSKTYDTIILDLWVGAGTLQMFREMLSAFTHFKSHLPEANVYVWGMMDKSINPAIIKDLCKYAEELKKARLEKVI